MFIPKLQRHPTHPLWGNSLKEHERPSPTESTVGATIQYVNYLNQLFQNGGHFKALPVIDTAFEDMINDPEQKWVRRTDFGEIDGDIKVYTRVRGVLVLCT